MLGSIATLLIPVWILLGLLARDGLVRVVAGTVSLPA